jgi:tRNA-specific 2-thiouridylase
MQNRIAVALSGGVDSSVAALMLIRSRLKHNFSQKNLIGIHMSNWNASDENPRYCKESEQDANDAQKVADYLNIKFHRVSFQAEYWTQVFEPFLSGLDAGLMLNPDIGCNTHIKFGKMREYCLKKLGVDAVATGHYARLWNRSIEDDGSVQIPTYIESMFNSYPQNSWLLDWRNESKMYPLLLAAADPKKDQSYFLSGVPGENFLNVIFPLGDLHKSSSENTPLTYCSLDSDLTTKTVRELAMEAGLPNASKRESMGICFIGKRNFSDFIMDYLPQEAKAGNFVDIDSGEIVGTHKGTAYYTIGQGAKISGASRKWFTAKKDTSSSTIFVCDNTHHPSLYSNELYIKSDLFNWSAGVIPSPMKNGQELYALCRIRHLQPLIPCVITEVDSYICVKFERPVRAITLGQIACLYVEGGLICLGSGQINKIGPTYDELGQSLPLVLHPSGSNDSSVVNRISNFHSDVYHRQ